MRRPRRSFLKAIMRVRVREIAGSDPVDTRNTTFSDTVDRELG